MDTAERIQPSALAHVPARRYDGADLVWSNQQTTEQQWCITKVIVGDWFGQENDRGQEDWIPQNGSSVLYFPAHFHVPARRYGGADSVRWHQDTTEQPWCITEGIVGDWCGQENDRGQEDWIPQKGFSLLYFPAHPMFLPAATAALIQCGGIKK